MEIQCSVQIYKMLNVIELYVFRIIAGNVPAYETIWIFGDRFVSESRNTIRRLFNMGNPSNDLIHSANRYNSHIAEKYGVKIFTTTDQQLNRSALGRLCNNMATAINSNSPLPKYILVVIEDNLIRCVNYCKPGVSLIFGRIIQWLADQYHSMLIDRKNALPAKCVKDLWPQIFWVGLPYHQSFRNGQTRFKFNQSLDNVIPLYNEMRVLKIRRRWNYNDSSVSRIGEITPAGHSTYWSGIDKALQFWENGRKRKTQDPQPGHLKSAKKRKMGHPKHDMDRNQY